MSSTFITKEKLISYKTNIETLTTNYWFDKDVLEKISINLLSNAVKYTPESGTIECNAFIKNNQLHFEVKNSGKGMTKDEIEKVFNRFYQIREDNKGTGIGLALVKELVTLHKGTINVESIPNNWTTFAIKLPITKKAFKEDEITIHAESNELTKKETNYIDTIETGIIIIDNSSIDEDKPILLIVDDLKI